jgi:AGCS family alanine or glycine:cation symporter
LTFKEGGSSMLIAQYVDQFFGNIVSVLGRVLFYPVPVVEIPFVLFVMVSGGIFFTLRYGFVNVRLFKHFFDVIRGRFDSPDDEGEIGHFQALTAALSATVGLGNIAGVAVAIKLGGPGAVFWLWVVAFFGMSMKFSSCTLGQIYREVDKKTGHVIGGPMVYLKRAYAEYLNLPRVGKVIGVLYAVTIIMGSFGGGNMFQSNQTFELIANQFPALGGHPLLVGAVLAFLVGIVLIGGIKRIGDVTSKLVPAMVAFYLISCFVIIFTNYSLIPTVFSEIFVQAFKPDAMYVGGFIGVFIQGVRRASFSNESGIGAAAIAHAAAKTDEPVREGVVAMIGPFIDTIVICSITALTILITGAHLHQGSAFQGAQITAVAFGSLGWVMPYLLTVATATFAYSTLISYSYYGEQAVEFLFGKKSIIAYRVIFVLVVVLGPLITLNNLVNFMDMMLLSMGVVNIIGMFFISKKVKEMTVDYIKRLKSGQMKRY